MTDNDEQLTRLIDKISQLQIHQMRRIAELQQVIVELTNHRTPRPDHVVSRTCKGSKKAQRAAVARIPTAGAYTISPNQEIKVGQTVRIHNPTNASGKSTKSIGEQYATVTKMTETRVCITTFSGRKTCRSKGKLTVLIHNE